VVLSTRNTEWLKLQGLLDDNNRPTQEAYEIASQTITYSSLCEELWELMDEDSVCNARGKEALSA